MDFFEHSRFLLKIIIPTQSRIENLRDPGHEKRGEGLGLRGGDHLLTRPHNLILPPIYGVAERASV